MVQKVSSRIHLVLFFTRGISLQAWDRMGIFEREVALYRELQKNGVKVTFVTYGNKKDLDFKPKLNGINTLCNRWNLPEHIYAKFVDVLHGRQLRGADIIKTNQTKGADIALKAARRWKKPLIARSGYMWSALASYHGATDEAGLAANIENDIYSKADGIVVTTELMRQYIVDRYTTACNINVIPNYVLTDYFCPDSTPIKKRICFLGRLEKEKNPLSLIKALVGIDVELVMIGKGPLAKHLLQLAQKTRLKVKLIDRVAHTEIPDLMRACALFVHVSPHEGHPKSLIEAMACGMAVIGADSPGIREIISHGHNGWLCGINPRSIRNAIQTLLQQPGLCQKLGQNARYYAVKHYALDRIVAMELEVYNRLLNYQTN
jgi:glycosyltransferase involved in cell wall biosynthesis